MKASKNCIEMIKQFEGFRSQPYTCAGGELTVGYGDTDDAHKGPVTEAEAADMLADELSEVDDELTKLVIVPLNQNQWDALACFTYNLGADRLSKSTLLGFVNTMQFDAARREFGRWVYADGKLLDGLVKRRAAEARLFATAPTPAPTAYAGTIPPERDFPLNEIEPSRRFTVSLIPVFRWFFGLFN